MVNLNLRVIIFVLIGLFSGTVIYAQLKVNSVFSDHMVLQQGVTTPVWGTAQNGEVVTVKFKDQVLKTTSNDGKWSVKLHKLPASDKPQPLSISTSDASIEIKDVLVGEVWLCSGQSNMERQLGPRPPQPLITNWEQERDAAAYPLIREYYVPLNYAEKPVDDVDSKWVVCSPNTVSDFSAVGYFFARDLYKDLNVPIGIIFSAFGGTPAEDWTRAEAMNKNPELAKLLRDYTEVMGKEGYRPKGQKPNGLYKGMVHPFLKYPIKGVAWYQGESNVDREDQYELVLETMIKNWREDFGQKKLPFLIVQITPHKDMKPEIREAQLNISQNLKNTALIVTTDVGLADEIHPPDKQPVGERLALAARGMVYGENVTYRGPVFDHYKNKKNKITLYFNETGKGLITSDGSKLKGFEVKYADGKKKKVDAVIKKNKVVLRLLPNADPIAIRYGWANVPDVNLANSFGLPASPFRFQTKRAK